MGALTKRFDQFMVGSSSNSREIMSCKIRGVGHVITQYPILITSLTLIEMIDYVSRGQRGPGILTVTPTTMGGGATQISPRIKANHIKVLHQLKGANMKLFHNKRGNTLLKTSWPSS